MTGRRHEENWQARRTEIVDRAAHLFARRGYHATGVSDLCAETGLGRGTLYHYIGSKENLLTLIHERAMGRIVEGAREALDMDAPAADRLLFLGRHLLEVVDRYPEHVTVALHEFKALSGEEAERVRASRRQVEDAVEEVLRQGVEAGELEVGDLRLATLAWLGMHNYSYIWYRHGGPHGPEEIARAFGELFLHGGVVGAAGRGHSAE